MAKKSMVAREGRRKFKVRVRNRCQFVDPNSGKTVGVRAATSAASACAASIFVRWRSRAKSLAS